MSPASMYALQDAVLTQMDVPAARTADFDGTAFDTLDYEGDILVLQEVNAVTGTTPSLAGLIKHSDTSGGAYTAVSGATFTAVTAANNRQAKSVRIGETKRFIKWCGVVTGTSPSLTAGAAFLGKKKYR